MSEYFLGKTEPKRKNNFWCICGIISAGFFFAIIIYMVVNMFLLSPKGNFILRTYIYKRFVNLEIGDIEEIGNFSIRVDVNDENNECIEQFEDFVTSKRWHLDSQKNAKEYYTSTKLPQLKVLMLTTLSPAMSFEVNDEQGRDRWTESLEDRTRSEKQFWNCLNGFQFLLGTNSEQFSVPAGNFSRNCFILSGRQF